MPSVSPPSLGCGFSKKNRSKHFLPPKDVLSIVRHIYFLLFWLLLGTAWASVQEPVGTGIARFSVVQLGTGVRVEVTLQAGFTCNGIQLLRSTDSVQFETAALIGGVCGSSSEEVSYDFYDAQPLNGQRLYYSLLLGGRIPSEVLSVRLLDFSKTGFVMWPNPARERLQLQIDNEQEQLFELQLVDLRGSVLVGWELRGSAFDLPLPLLPAGLYLVRLQNRSSGQAWQQRLLVQ